MIRRFLVWLHLFILLMFPSKSLALSGVGAKLEQASGGVSVSISGLHSPHCEIVVINRQGEVIASALDQGFGSFSFNFKVPPADLGHLQIFAVDAAGQTNPISLPSTGLNNVLLPPSLVIDPITDLNGDDVLVGGYSFPDAQVTVSLEQSGQSVTSAQITTDSNGAWSYEFSNIPSGDYTVVAVSQLLNQRSFNSFPLQLTVEALNPVIQVSDTVSDVVENVAELVLPPLVTEVAKEVAPQIEQVNKAVTPVAGAGLLSQLLFIWKDLLYWLFQTATTLMQYFGFWRKRHPWGVVYDAFTKQPIMLATVRLYTLEKFPRLIETDVTSKAGVFSFFPKAGKYLLKIAKTGYSFPSLLVRSTTDGEYSHVYHGEEIDFKDEQTPVEVSVPLDPAKVNVTWRFRVVNIIRTRLYLLTFGMLLIGWLLSLIAVVGGQGGVNSLVLLFYTTVISAQLYLGYRRRKSWGIVEDVSGNPVVGLQLNLVEPKFERLVQRRVTDTKGKYQFVVPEGGYEIRIDSSSISLVTGHKESYQGQEIRVNGAKPQLIALKLVVNNTNTT